MISKFVESVNQRHRYACQWKEKTGGKVLGYFCTYVPEEVAYAGGILPVRILGGLEPQDVSEAHITSMYCPFCRDCLAQGLMGKYDYLDGVATARSCLHIAQAFWSWTFHLPVAYKRFVNMPSLMGTPQARQFLLAELEEFKRSLEEWCGQAISARALAEAIEVYNRNRRLLHQLYELRRREPPLLSGTEAAAVVLSSLLMDKAEHSQLLEKLLAELPGRGDGPQPAPRLMVLGSENHDLGLLQLIEDAGANIVIEEHCLGSRYFWNQAPTDRDPLGAIALRYLERPRCPVKDVLERQRFHHILKLVRDFEVQGVLFIQQKFCDPHEFDIPPLSRFLKDNQIPSFFLELDVTMNKGAIRTRTEAFLETLELE